MHLEEQLAALIAALNANTRSNDDLAKLMRVAAVADTPAPAKTTRAKKETPAAPEPETPEPEPETPEPTPEPAPTPEPEEKDDTDWVAKAKEATIAFRRDNPDKRADQVAAMNVLFNEFGVDKISSVPAERGKEFYDKLQSTFV